MLDVSDASDGLPRTIRTHHALYATRRVAKRFVLRDSTQAAIPTVGRSGVKESDGVGG